MHANKLIDAYPEMTFKYSEIILANACHVPRIGDAPTEVPHIASTYNWQVQHTH